MAQVFLQFQHFGDKRDHSIVPDFVIRIVEVDSVDGDLTKILKNKLITSMNLCTIIGD